MHAPPEGQGRWVNMGPPPHTPLLGKGAEGETRSPVLCEKVKGYGQPWGSRPIPRYLERGQRGRRALLRGRCPIDKTAPRRRTRMPEQWNPLNLFTPPESDSPGSKCVPMPYPLNDPAFRTALLLYIRGMGAFHTRMTGQWNLPALHAMLSAILPGSTCSHNLCPPHAPSSRTILSL